MLTKIYENPAVYRVDVPLPDNPLKNLNCYVCLLYTSYFFPLYLYQLIFAHPAAASPNSFARRR